MLIKRVKFCFKLYGCCLCNIIYIYSVFQVYQNTIDVDKVWLQQWHLYKQKKVIFFYAHFVSGGSTIACSARTLGSSPHQNTVFVEFAWFSVLWFPSTLQTHAGRLIVFCLNWPMYACEIVTWDFRFLKGRDWSECTVCKVLCWRYKNACNKPCTFFSTKRKHAQTQLYIMVHHSYAASSPLRHKYIPLSIYKNIMLN